ncbi:uncharacterized protein LOC118271196 isoform X2 [Spodoptera frugiperda]|uniref:Uncharacterized protein LOC118271196 isoform X2 n=1 Tax=Spodoptera frugiperda TaxID=7108 RepID=A0A9R0ELE5_SPOFR|nr:uncharacterized protein LOC118271196 isoform X2 [Spodoptera frugiperda]
MIYIQIQFLLFNYIVVAYAEDYESDDKLYMLVSQDQHQHTPRLEDFFWTGSGDGPPPPPDPPLPAPVQPSTPVVRTTTVLATVYLDSYPPQAVTDKSTGECVLNCGEPGVPGSLEPEIPDDRRYWLLTVIQGSTPDSLQLRLARLYQKAFLRQQERHLGIIKSLDAPPARKKHDVHSFAVNKDNNISPVGPQGTNSPFKYLDIDASMVPIDSIVGTTINNDEDTSTKVLDSSREFVYPANIEMFSIDSNTLTLNAEIKATRLNEVESWILATPTVSIRKREVTDREQLEEIREDSIDIPLESEANETMLFKREILKPEQQPPVQVHIQNITESPETGSIQIVYVVLVGGRAVPAAVAARDMRLVRDAEVARELGAVVTTKAEPYLKTAEGLEGDAGGGVHGTELWALAVGATVAVLLLLVLLALLCLAHRKKTMKSAASIRAYRNELLREAERNQLKQVHEEKDGRLISVVSPSRTRPSSTLLPIYRAASAASSSSTSSGVSEVATAFRRRQKKPHALRMPQKKRVGTTDSLLEAAGLDSSDSGQPSAPPTPTSYLSMPSVNAFPRGNVVEPLSRILEPVSVRHLDIDSPADSPKKSKEASKDVVPRRQMASQLVRLGSIDKDPGVIGPLVWDLHCQRIKDSSKPSSPARSATSGRKEPGASRMRQRFNELMDDAFTLFGSVGSSPNSQDTYTVEEREPKEKGTQNAGVATVPDPSEQLAQARNDNVRLPGSPYTAMDTVRGRSAGPGRAGPSTSTPVQTEGGRPRTSFTRTAAERRVPPPTRAWGQTPPQSLGGRPAVNPALIAAEGRLPAEDPAIPLISAIKTEIQRIKETATKPTTLPK